MAAAQRRRLLGDDGGEAGVQVVHRRPVVEHRLVEGPAHRPVLLVGDEHAGGLEVAQGRPLLPVRRGEGPRRPGEQPLDVGRLEDQRQLPARQPQEDRPAAVALPQPGEDRAGPPVGVDPLGQRHHGGPAEDHAPGDHRGEDDAEHPGGVAQARARQPAHRGARPR
ncbi:hypothetical protein, partial [Georgenia thermotolerans]|uniref:hypothetical protein n=1 Tax=Georgenia thermotolerans TaxID=527326 RepID=UPI001B8C0C5B